MRAILLLLLLAAPKPRLGDPAPDFDALREYRGEKHVALVFCAGGCGASPLARTDTALVIADPAGPAARAYAAAEGSAFLIDKDGILRGTTTAAGVPALVEAWNTGAPLFASICGRCHGADGRDTSYSGIKPLGGIGNRLTRDQIRGRLNPLRIGEDQFSVRAHPLSKAELEALITFIAGL